MYGAWTLPILSLGDNMRKTEITPDSRRVTVWLPEELVARADRLAAKGDMERGRLLRNLIEVGIESLEGSDKVGLLQLSLIIRDMEDALKKWGEDFRREGFKKFWT